jgi:hypothetical protein
MEEERIGLLANQIDELRNEPIAGLYSKIRCTIVRDFDTPYSVAQLQSVEIQSKHLQPILRYLTSLNSKTCVYVALLNYADFMYDAQVDIGYAQINKTRAMACQLLAIELLSNYRNSYVELIQVLTTEFSPKQGLDSLQSPNSATSTVSSLNHLRQMSSSFYKNNEDSERESALGVAARAGAKLFTASPLVQNVVRAIWKGEIIFHSHQVDSDRFYCDQSDRSTQSSLTHGAVLHKPLPFSFGGIFRPSRIRVPVYQNWFNIVIFLLLIALFSIVLIQTNPHVISLLGLSEPVHMIPTLLTSDILLHILVLALTIEEVRQIVDGGLQFYFQNVWNYLDICIYVIFWTSFGMRIYSIQHGNAKIWEDSVDLLACNAVLIWPRLLTILDRYPFFGTMIISMKYMIRDTALFFALFIVFFVGFFQSIVFLAPRSIPGDIKYTTKDVFSDLVRIFFGSSFLGFDRVASFSNIFAQVLMVIYIAICALYLMNILISVLSKSFSKISENAQMEHQYNFTVKVMEFVNSDNLFPFVPPFNLIQIFVIYPLSPFVDARTYARINRTAIRLLFSPILIMIFFYERWFANFENDIISKRHGHRRSVYIGQSLEDIGQVNEISPIYYRPIQDELNPNLVKHIRSLESQLQDIENKLKEMKEKTH